jgi:hypothetical protein
MAFLRSTLFVAAADYPSRVSRKVESPLPNATSAVKSHQKIREFRGGMTTIVLRFMTSNR